MEYDKECLQAFLEEQYKLFGEPVVATMGEAKTFLEENMAAVVCSNDDVVKYLKENGMDTSGMTVDEIIDQAEVFALPRTGRYLIVEA